LKLLIQELQVMNVQMRIITEENVDQLLNLSYQSKNLNKLMNVSDTDFKDMNALVTQYKMQLNDKISKASNEAIHSLGTSKGSFSASTRGLGDVWREERESKRRSKEATDLAFLISKRISCFVK
jgi:hypothetical protein